MTTQLPAERIANEIATAELVRAKLLYLTSRAAAEGGESSEDFYAIQATLEHVNEIRGHLHDLRVQAASLTVDQAHTAVQEATSGLRSWPKIEAVEGIDAEVLELIEAASKTEPMEHVLHWLTTLLHQRFANSISSKGPYAQITFILEQLGAAEAIQTIGYHAEAPF